ncbi:MAG: NADH-quinone oxidoreductase subunit N [Deltaproteobacteria bacterium]|nr:NADH-quinone oxidoreductase subunit N [Deltaproteobacteria bacterium]
MFKLNINDIISILPEMIVALGACFILIVDLFTGKDRKCLVAALSVVTVIAAAVATWWLTGSDIAGILTFSGMFAADYYSAFLKFLFYAAAIMTILMSHRYLKDEDINLGEYYVLVLFALSGMMVMASGKDLLMLYVGTEMMSIPIYALVGFAQHDKRSNEGALKYVILGAFSSGVMLFGISLVYGLCGTTALDGVAEALKAADAASPAMILAVTLLFAGFAFKIAGVPFHMWAPDAYEGAPTPITAYMSVGAKAAAFAVLLRVFAEGFAPMYEQWKVLVIVVSLASMIYGNFTAIAQKNIKRMLAYSSIGHAGYALLGLVAYGEQGVASVLFYLAVYTAMNMGAFAVVLLMKRNGKGGELISDYTGLAKNNKLTALVMLIFLFSLAGIPPTAGFMGKFYVFVALLEKGFVAVAIVALLASAVAAYFYIRIIMLMYMKDAPKDADTCMCEKDRGLAFVIIVAVIVVIGLGVYPGCIIDLAVAASKIL